MSLGDQRDTQGRVQFVYPNIESLLIMVITTSPHELQAKLLIRNWPNITPGVH